MLRIAKEYEEEYPEAATILCPDRYMDNLIHSCSTPQEAVNRMTALDQVLAKGSFQIKKWYCSFQLKRTKVIEAPLTETKEGTAQSDHRQGLQVKEVYLDGERENISRPLELAGTLQQIP